MHAGEARLRKGQGVGGEEDFRGGDFVLAAAAGSEVQVRLGAPGHVLDAMIFVDVRAAALGGARQASDELAGIERAAGDLVHHSQGAGIIPSDW